MFPSSGWTEIANYHIQLLVHYVPLSQSRCYARHVAYNSPCKHHTMQDPFMRLNKSLSTAWALLLGFIQGWVQYTAVPELTMQNFKQHH